MRFWLLGIILAFVPLSSAQVTDTGNIIGQVRIVRGSFPSHRIAVNLVTRGFPLGTLYTDDEGRFAFLLLAPNRYHLTVDEKEYLPVSVDTELKGGMTANLLIELTLRQTSMPADPRAASGGNPYLASPHDYATRFPRKAVKEFEAGVKSDAKTNLESAIGHYQKALKIAPDFFPARNNLGSDYMNQGNLEAAETEFERVIQGDPTDAAAYLNLGNVLLLTKRYDLAECMIQEGLDKQPNSAFGLFLRGSLRQRTNRGAEAENDLRRAMQLDPGLTKARLALVNLYLQQHRPSDAQRELSEFLKAAPDDPLAPKAREVMGKLNADKRPSH